MFALYFDSVDIIVLLVAFDNLQAQCSYGEDKIHRSVKKTEHDIGNN